MTFYDQSRLGRRQRPQDIRIDPYKENLQHLGEREEPPDKIKVADQKTRIEKEMKELGIWEKHERARRCGNWKGKKGAKKRWNLNLKEN